MPETASTAVAAGVPLTAKALVGTGLPTPVGPVVAARCFAGGGAAVGVAEAGGDVVEVGAFAEVGVERRGRHGDAVDAPAEPHSAATIGAEAESRPRRPPTGRGAAAAGCCVVDVDDPDRLARGGEAAGQRERGHGGLRAALQLALLTVRAGFELGARQRFGDQAQIQAGGVPGRADEHRRGRGTHAWRGSPGGRRETPEEYPWGDEPIVSPTVAQRRLRAVPWCPFRLLPVRSRTLFDQEWPRPGANRCGGTAPHTRSRSGTRGRWRLQNSRGRVIGRQSTPAAALACT